MASILSRGPTSTGSINPSFAESIAPRSEYVVDGALMSYSALLSDQIRRSAQMVDMILKGTKKPADIPVEQPTKFELVLNVKTAKALSITLPGEILLQANRVIE